MSLQEVCNVGRFGVVMSATVPAPQRMHVIRNVVSMASQAKVSAFVGRHALLLPLQHEGRFAVQQLPPAISCCIARCRKGIVSNSGGQRPVTVLMHVNELIRCKQMGCQCVITTLFCLSVQLTCLLCVWWERVVVIVVVAVSGLDCVKNVHTRLHHTHKHGVSVTWSFHQQLNIWMLTSYLYSRPSHSQ